jgi:hypothetical protein
MSEEIAEGFSSVGEIAMGEVGAGSDGEYAEVLVRDEL